MIIVSNVQMQYFQGVQLQYANIGSYELRVRMSHAWYIHICIGTRRN